MYLNWDRDNEDDVKRAMSVCGAFPTKDQCIYDAASLVASLDSLQKYGDHESGRQLTDFLDTKQSDRDKYQAVKADTDTCVDGSKRVAVNVSSYIDATLSCTRSLLDSSEIDYAKFTRLTYFLYGAGWLVALGGKLFGFDVETAE